MREDELRCRRTEAFERMKMKDNHEPVAEELVKILVEVRERVIEKLLVSAKARIEGNKVGPRSFHAEICNQMVAVYADEALCATCRDGFSALEQNIEWAVDEIVREQLIMKRRPRDEGNRAARRQ